MDMMDNVHWTWTWWTWWTNSVHRILALYSHVCMYVHMYVCHPAWHSFLYSESKLTQPLPQYTVHRTLNRIISRTLLAQFGLVFLLKKFPPTIFHSTLVHKWVHCLPIISDKPRIRTDYFGLVILGSNQLFHNFVCFLGLFRQTALDSERHIFQNSTEN